ncbi:MAG: NAD-dependent epimerase/dehydratase family protein [Candidatus Omnitrophica bacterium]|nr:NAD-dependent epimerase/dehydratase family protein [Candidatus Omnitrophota bacterium]
MKKVLIIGGLGFIGCHLAEQCIDKGYEVSILSRSKGKIKNIQEIEKRIKLIIKDAKDLGEEVKGFDYIFHLAGSTDNYAIIEDQPYKDIEMNCTATIALLEAVKKYNPKARVVFASTFFVNGRPEKLPVDANAKCEPLGVYGATRLAAEHFCRVYHNVFDLDIVIARFTNVFGDREQPSNKKAGFNYMIKKAVDGGEILLYDNGDFYRDYIYVTDAASACITIAEKGRTGEVYYVGRGEFVKFKELTNIVAREAGVNVKPVTPPDFHKRVGIKDFVCDNTKLKKLGWEPKVSIKEGIKKTIHYYKNQAK